ncbi:hypothetical protein DICSQDRAFT_90353, partial [Dichomitus squalens LYAD-421 SS1]
MLFYVLRGYQFLVLSRLAFRTRRWFSAVATSLGVRLLLTKMTADHTMGLLTFLRIVLGIPKPPGAVPRNAPPPNKRPPRVEIFGPRGVRRMLRMLWHITHTHSEFAYVVHELLFPGEQPSVPAEVRTNQESVDEVDVRSESECVGRDIWCDEQGFWRGLVDMSPKQAHCLWGAVVDAGPIEHRDPCIGYVIREIPRDALSPTSATPRKFVILGDTYDASSIIPLVHADANASAPTKSNASTSDVSVPTRVPISLSSPHIDFSVLPLLNPHGNDVHVRVPVSLLVHEATDAYLPPHIDPQQRTGKNRTPESVTEKAVSRGHSTPAMAGAFARAVAAEKLVMNHIGARFPAPEMEYSNHHGGGRNQFRLGCMRELERQAAVGWNSKRRMHSYVQAARDHLTVSIVPNKPRQVIDVDDEEDAFAQLQEPQEGATEPLGKGKMRAPGPSQPRLSREDIDASMVQEVEYVGELELGRSVGISASGDGDATADRVAANTRRQGKRRAPMSDGSGAGDSRGGSRFRLG